MSRVYFHTPSGTAEIRGSERAWLSFVAAGPAMYAWDLDRTGLDSERAYQLVEMNPEPEPGEFGSNYLHTYMREAKAEEDRWRKAYKEYETAGRPYGPLGGPRYNHEHQRRFIDALKTNLRVQGFELHINGHRLHTSNIELNTALVAGSDVVALAAKIHGWCEVHAWVDGQDRDWLAGLVEQGLETGIFRRGVWYDNGPDEERTWASQGWEELVPFLRARNDEPVVMSYSVCDQFPTPHIEDWQWQPTELPDDWRPSWANDEKGLAEWESFGEETKQEERNEARQDSWYDLPGEQKWELAMAALREQRPWARIGPDNLRTTSFHKMVTVYDLFAPDRDERIAAAFTSEGEEEKTLSLTGK